MLVVTRKKQERILIGNDIVITIIDCRAGKVRVGIDAPKEVPINREEVHQRIQNERIRDQ